MTLTQRILERDGYRCAYHGGRATEIDHIFSRAEGQRQEIARDDEEWIVAACHDCNGRKGTRKLVPPSMAERIPDLNDMTPGRFWLAWDGGKVVSEVLI